MSGWGAIPNSTVTISITDAYQIHYFDTITVTAKYSGEWSATFQIPSTYRTNTPVTYGEHRIYFTDANGHYMEVFVIPI